MNKNQMLKSRAKPEKIELEVGAIYRIEGKLYQAVEKIRNTTQVLRLDEDGNPKGRAVILGSLTHKDVEKISE